MGSEAHTELEIISSTGLIPRFLQDLFGELSSSGDEFCLETSFLEVYGDDIHDLLDLSRTVLPLREDGGGGVACNGLTVKRVSSAVEAVQVLHEGTMNRSTAATFMNSTSSRSHAVFTLSLRRQAVLSKLTFVDLAGSERMKKTGAEGERAREGIQINMGLLALGNVINALADDERMQSGGKKVHVPYRQSKLTRLLQDALGGNSQTVFLACVSSSDANASETLSTLHYANRARNIQNAPIRNVDFSPERSQQYIAYISLLEAELIAHKFGPYTDGVSPLLRENDVNKYFDILRDRANCNLSAAANSVCFSHESTTFANTEINDEQTLQLKRSYQPVLENKDVAMLAEINPDAELAILDQLLELQQQDQDYDREQKKDDEALKYVEVELVEKERLLLHLRDSLKVYHSMKAKYESLIVEVQNLEREKIELSKQLEKASSDPALGCSRAIKKEIEVVERSLERARNETRKHRQMFNKAEQEAHKCRALELKIHDLKQGRANLIKKQREAAVRHRELTESKTKEIMALKRKDRDAERKLSKLETEIRLHKRYLDNRHAYCKKLMEQKKQAESHLMKLLAMRQRKHCNKTKFDGSGDLVSAKSTMKNESQNSNSHLNEEVESVMFALEKAIEELVSSSELKSEYEKRVGAYSDVVRKMVGAVKQLEKPSVEDREELIEAVRELDVKIELAAAELDKIQSRMPNTVKDDDEAFETLILQLLSEKSALVLRNIVACFTTKVAKAEVSCKTLQGLLLLNSMERALIIIFALIYRFKSVNL
jgi:kinesin family protein 4/21/27